MTWSKSEIIKLNEFEYLQNELCSIPIDLIDEYDDDIINMLFLEAELIILNKDVIGYRDNEIIGIYTFKEALKMEDFYIQRLQLFTFHVTNVKSHREQQKYIF